MTFSRLEAMNEYWRSNPPIHIMLKNRWGFEAKPQESKEADLDQLMNELMSLNAKN